MKGTRYLDRKHPSRASRFFSITLILIGVTCNAWAQSDISGGTASREAARFAQTRFRNESGTIPNDAILSALAQKRQLPVMPDAWGFSIQSTRSSTLASNSWSSLGPGNCGGRVRALATHPTDPQILWAATVGSGIWKTTNGGVAWFSLDSFPSSIPVSCLLVDGKKPDVIYAGTGDGLYGTQSVIGSGIFKSTNAGATWAQMPSSVGVFDVVNRLAMSPTDSQVILAATRNGIFGSTDGGASWILRQATEVTDIDMHPTSGTSCLASGPNGAVFYSSDGGVTWKKPSGLPSSGRIDQAFARNAPTIVYASTESGLYRSKDSGHVFVLINSETRYLGANGSYANTVWVDPTDSRNIVIGGSSLWRSTNGGAILAQIPVTSATPIAGQHQLIAATGYNGTNNRRVYCACDGGVFRAEDILSVGTAGDWQPLNNGLCLGEFHGIAADPATSSIIAGAMNLGTLRYGGGGWQTLFGGNGSLCAIDPFTPGAYCGVNSFLRLFIGTNLLARYVYTGIADAEANSLFVAPFAIDPQSSDRAMAGGASLWRTTNLKSASPTWVMSRSARGPKISAIAFTPSKSSIIWLGYEDGQLFYTLNGNESAPSWWRVDRGTREMARCCTSITIDPNVYYNVYVTYGGFSSSNIWFTSDYGGHWTNISGNLPPAPVYCLALTPTATNCLYAGTEVGAFASTDGGTSWSPCPGGPGDAPVEGLCWMTNTLFAATRGRGLFAIQPLVFPAITIQPIGATNLIGGSSSLRVDAIGNAPLRFQWQKNGVDIAGATNNTFSISTLTQSDSADYTVTVANGLGSIISSPAAISVLPLVSMAQALDTPWLTWTTSGSGTWIGQPLISYDGNAAAQSTLVQAGVNRLETTIPGPGTISFWWKLESNGSGSLTVYLDGVSQSTLTGQSDWQQQAIELGNGNHTLRWEHIDGVPTVDTPTRAWIDQVTFTPLKSLFTRQSLALPALSSASMSWGDFDNDGNPDLALVGLNADGMAVAQVWRNLGNGTFTNINSGVQGTFSGSVAWGDFDNDGKLDLLTTGSSGYPDYLALAQVWRNLGNGTFSNINVGLPGVFYSSAAWGDFDNDGRLDILLSGHNGTQGLCQIWRNMGDGTFRQINAGLPSLYRGAVGWCDFDNDGRLDIIIAGQGDSGPTTQIWRNLSDGSFSNINAGITGIIAGSVACGDYNNDGWMDVLVSGIDSNGQNIAQVWRNRGDGTFININAGLPGIQFGYAIWGDYDNDGIPDILLAGNDGTNCFTKVFWNDGAGAFFDINGGLPGVYKGQVSWADYDHSGRLELMLIGQSDTNALAQFWQNHASASNSPPATPLVLQSSVANNVVLLSWNAAQDRETSRDGLTYRLRVGTTPGGHEIVSPELRVSVGLQRIAPAGGTPKVGTLLTKLVPGKRYYWAVQTVDSGMSASAFSAEATFDLSNTDLRLLAPRMDDFDANGRFRLRFTGNATTSYRVWASSDITLPLSQWTVLGPATYSNGEFELLDPQPRAVHQRFYRVTSP